MIDITPITPSLGADVSGFNIADFSNEDFDALYKVWIDREVVRLRNQPIDDSVLQAFSKHFGALEEMPLGLMPESERLKIKNRYVTVLSNIKVDGKYIGGLKNAEATWHSDMTYVENPPPASILMGVEIPKVGGDTYFASQSKAHDAVPPALLERVQGLSIKHNAAHTSIGSLRPGYEAFDDPREAPGAVHPIVQTHPENGKQVLYLGRREYAYVPGLSLADSEALLDELWEYAALPENILKQEWQVGDVIIWDNRSVLHRRDGFDDAERRLMKRCQVLSPVS